jgi:O-antigen ligase
MMITTIEPRKNLFLTLSVLVMISVLGLVVGIDIRSGIFIASLLGALTYVVLCIIRPFAAFVIFVALGLTIWLSSISLIGGFSVVVGVGLIFVGIWISRLLLRQAQILWRRELWPILGIFVALVLSTALNWGGPAGLAGVFTYFQLLLLTVLLVNFADSPERLKKLGYIFIITSALLALMILLDQAGLLPAGLVNSVEGHIFVNGSLDAFERSGGIFGDPNFTSLQLLAGLPFILEFWSHSPPRQRVGLALAGLLIVTGLRYTYSMGGLVGLAVILLLKTFILGRRNILLVTLQTILLGVVGWWLAFNVLPEYYLERVWANLDLFSQFIKNYDMHLFLRLGTTRGDTWSAAFQTFLQSPMWGWGPGNSVYLNPSHSIFHHYFPKLAAHNFILAVATDLGAFGLFFLVALLLIAVRACWFRRGEQLPVRNAVFVALVASMVQGLGIDMQTQKHFWVLISMALAIKMVASKTQFESGEG